VAVDGDFDIGSGGEDMPQVLELPGEPLEVVEFAVTDGDEIASLIVDRLVTANQIDDAESPHGQRTLRVVEITSFVGTPVNEMPDDLSNVSEPIGHLTDCAGNAAHASEDLSAEAGGGAHCPSSPTAGGGDEPSSCDADSENEEQRCQRGNTRPAGLAGGKGGIDDGDRRRVIHLLNARCLEFL